MCLPLIPPSFSLNIDFFFKPFPIFTLLLCHLFLLCVTSILIYNMCTLPLFFPLSPCALPFHLTLFPILTLLLCHLFLLCVTDIPIYNNILFPLFLHLSPSILTFSLTTFPYAPCFCLTSFFCVWLIFLRMICVPSPYFSLFLPTYCLSLSPFSYTHPTFVLPLFLFMAYAVLRLLWQSGYDCYNNQIRLLRQSWCDCYDNHKSRCLSICFYSLTHRFQLVISVFILL